MVAHNTMWKCGVNRKFDLFKALTSTTISVKFDFFNLFSFTRALRFINVTIYYKYHAFDKNPDVDTLLIGIRIRNTASKLLLV